MRKQPPESECAGEPPFSSGAADRSLRERRRAEDERIRKTLERAALAISGEAGYRSLTVKAMLERSGASRSRFYSLFANKEECYASAYGAASERVAEELLEASRGGGDWTACFRRALERLAEFLAGEPAVARGLIAEVHVVGGTAMAKRTEAFERLSRAVDRARRETTSSRHSPPPITASFIVSAIESAAIRSLASGNGGDFAATMPDLLYLALSLYFGSEQAAAEYRRARRAS